MSNKEIIITFDGTPAVRTNCRKIKNEFYEINRQCFKMSDDKWHRINNGKVVAQGSPTSLIENIDAKKAYFGDSFKIS